MGVKAERDMQHVNENLSGMTVTCNGASMTSRVLSPEEKVRAGAGGGKGKESSAHRSQSPRPARCGALPHH